MIYKGFNYLQKKYIWYNSELFCLPYESKLRFYGLRKCKFDGKHYCLANGVRKSINQLKSMTTDIESDFVFIKNKDCPF